MALGAILSQGEIGKDRHISYASRMLRGAELRYDLYELEALAMVFGIKHFRHYIVGSHFTIVTDHKPLLWFKTADASTRVLKWRFILSEYDYDVVYRAGKRNVNADALSRNIPREINVVTRSKTNSLTPRRPFEIDQQPTRIRKPNAPEKNPSTEITKKKRGRPPKVNEEIDLNIEEGPEPEEI